MNEIQRLRRQALRDKVCEEAEAMRIARLFRSTRDYKNAKKRFDYAVCSLASHIRRIR